MAAIRLLVCAQALALLALGAALANAPVRTAGPMNIDLQLPVGAACLAGGLALLEAAPSGWRRPLFLFAALAVAAIAGRNLYFYPPIDDGAYFMLRYGRDGVGDWAPAGVPAHAVACAPIGWALARAMAPDRLRFRG